MSKVMKTFGKRGLTLLLAVVMSFSLIVPTSMAAEDETDINDDVITVESEDAVEEETVVDDENEVVFENAIVPLMADEKDDLENEPKVFANDDCIAFAIYSSDDNSLTFYTDNEVPETDSEYNSKTVTEVYTGFDSRTYSTASSVPWNSNRTNIKSVVIDESFNNCQPTAMSYWFYNFTNATFTGLENVDASNVTTLYYMFGNCSSLENVDSLASWNTSNVTSLRNTFYGCSSLTNVGGLANWNTSAVTILEYTFYNCSSLTNVDAFANWDTSSVTTLHWTFYGCSSLTNVDGLVGWNTSNVTALENTFYGCSSLTNVDGLAGWNTSNVTTLESTFFNCSKLENVDGLVDWNTSNVTSLRNTFCGCSSLENVNELTGWNTSKVTTLYRTFYDCSGLKNIDGLSVWDVSNVENMTRTFAGCHNLDTITLNWTTSNVTDTSFMFYDCNSLITIYAKDFITESITNDEQMFFGCSHLIGSNGTAYINNYVDTSNYAHVDTANNPGYFSAIDSKQQVIVEASAGDTVDIPAGATWIKFTPEETGPYCFYSEDENANFTLFIYSEWGESISGNDYDFDWYIGGETYYILVASSGCEITVSEAPHTIDLNEEYSSNNLFEVYKYEVEETGYYTFDSNFRTWMCIEYSPSWNEAYDLGFYYESYTFCLYEGEEYYFIVCNNYDDSNYCAKLTLNEYGVEWFTMDSDKESIGSVGTSQDTVTYTLATQVTMPYESNDSPTLSVYPEGWNGSHDDILTFHDTLDDELVVDEDSFVLTFNVWDSWTEEYYTVEIPSTYYDYWDDYTYTLYTIDFEPDDECTFDVAVNIYLLWWCLYYNIYSDLEYSYFELTYDASLAYGTQPGEYNNSAYVEWAYFTQSGDVEISIKPYADDDYVEPDYRIHAVSDTLEVPVDTYGLAVYKYEDEDITPMDARTLAAGDPLQGAIFDVYDEDMNWIETIETGKSGYAYAGTTFADGTILYLKETQAPDGYILNDELFQVEIGNDYFYVSDYWYGVGVPNNPYTHEVWFYKYDSDYTYTDNNFWMDAGLSDAEFILSRMNDEGNYEYAVTDYYFDGWDNFYTISYWDEDISLATSLATNRYGYFAVTNLETGSYILTETSAPEGYIALDESVYFTVDSNGYVTVTNDNDKVFVDDELYPDFIYVCIANDPVSTAFDINKTDMNDNPLEGAEFVLGSFSQVVYAPPMEQYSIKPYTYTDDGNYAYYYLMFDYDKTTGVYTFDAILWPYTENQSEATRLTTNADGSISVSGLPLSSSDDWGYFLIETKAPDGYELLEDPIVFSINDDGTIQLWIYDETHVSTDSDNRAINVVDESSTHDFYLDKVAEDGYTHLDGAVFHLSDADGDLYFVESDDTYTLASSDTDGASTDITAGSIHIDGLSSGTYTLTETKAPDGYSLLSDSIQFTIANDGTLTLEVSNSNVSIADTTMTVTNSMSSPMPEAGGIGTWLVYTIGLAAIAGTGVILYSRKRRLA